MAQNTTVAADPNAPPVTRILAQFASGHPSRGWSDAVEHEAHRTLLNWVGCAIGAARHPTLEAALAAMQELAPAPQASVLGRNERVDMASAALLNGISSHTFDFDDTHLKTIIHPAGPVASAALALAEHIGSSGRQLIDALVLGIDVACRVGQHDLSGALRPRLAYHRHDGNARCGCGMRATSRPRRRAHDDGARHRGVAADRRARAVRLDDQAVPSGSGGTCGPHRGADGEARLHVVARARSRRRAVSRRPTRRSATGTRSPTRSASASRFRSTRTSRSPAASSSIRRSTAACNCATRTGCGPTTSRASICKVHSLVLELTGKRSPRTGLEAKFSVYHACAAGMLFGRAGEAEFDDELVVRGRRDCAARPHPRDRRRFHRGGRRRRHRHAHRWPHAAPLRPARDRQPRATDERRGSRAQVPRARRSGPWCRACTGTRGHPPRHRSSTGRAETRDDSTGRVTASNGAHVACAPGTTTYLPSL